MPRTATMSVSWPWKRSPRTAISRPSRKKFNGLFTEGIIDGQKTGLLLPQTFMNKSGDSVIAAMSFFKLHPEDIYVLYDELDLAPGKVRIKKRWRQWWPQRHPLN